VSSSESPRSGGGRGGRRRAASERSRGGSPAEPRASRGAGGGTRKRVNPKIHYVEALAKLFGVPVTYFFDEETPADADSAAGEAKLMALRARELSPRGRRQVMDLLELVKPHVIAHSFGGQVAITLAATRPDRVGKLILVGSAGVRTRRTPAVRLKRSAARVGKWLAAHGGWLGEKVRDSIYRRVQSQDYAGAGPLRATLVKVVNEDLRALLPRIQSPTLLVWGEHDRDVPLSAAQMMAELIPDAHLVVLENAGHFSYLDQFGRFRLIVGRFLRDDGKAVEIPRT